MGQDEWSGGRDDGTHSNARVCWSEWRSARPLSPVTCLSGKEREREKEGGGERDPEG